MSPTQLGDPARLEAVLTSGEFLLFKHSLRCSTSSYAFREYRRFLGEHPEIASGWIDVVEQRTLAQDVAERVGVRHKSPQALWLHDGHVLWHASHFDITNQSLCANVLGTSS